MRIFPSDNKHHFWSWFSQWQEWLIPEGESLAFLSFSNYSLFSSKIEGCTKCPKQMPWVFIANLSPLSTRAPALCLMIIFNDPFQYGHSFFFSSWSLGTRSTHILTECIVHWTATWHPTRSIPVLGMRVLEATQLSIEDFQLLCWGSSGRPLLFPLLLS